MTFLTNKPEITNHIKNILENSIRALARGQPIVPLAFSGGLDSGILAQLLSNLNKKFTLYTICTENSKDHKNSTALAEEMGWNLKPHIINPTEIESFMRLAYSILAKAKLPINPLFLSINALFLALASLVRRNGHSSLMIGTGADSIFGGFAKHSHHGTNFATREIQRNLMASLDHAIKEEAKAQDIIAKHYNLKILRPFLNKNLINFAMRVHPNLKINKQQNKIILRQVALQIGLPKKSADMKKAAAQYSSGFDKALGTIARKNKSRHKHEYLSFLRKTLL